MGKTKIIEVSVSINNINALNNNSICVFLTWEIKILHDVNGFVLFRRD
jgi:hypothetical protein